MISDYMHGELTNWARWATFSCGSVGHCKSLEHRYKSESDIDKKANTPIEVINADAVKIEKILVSPNTPKRNKKLIIAHYAYRTDHKITCKDLGLSFKSYDIELERSVKMLENILDSSNKKAYAVSIKFNRDASTHVL